ncbi:MAG: LLM class F420-dependent oxidoreductase, partial [Candidatus Binatia bacterium]
EILAPMWEAWSRGDRKAAVAAVPTQVVNDLLIRGSIEEIRAHVQRYLAAGITTAILQFFTFETDKARKRELVRETIRGLGPA